MLCFALLKIVKWFRYWCTYRLGEEDRGEEVVEDFADLEVLRDVLVMLLHQFIFPRGQVRQNLIIKIHVRLHIYFFLYALSFFELKVVKQILNL